MSQLCAYFRFEHSFVLRPSHQTHHQISLMFVIFGAFIAQSFALWALTILLSLWDVKWRSALTLCYLTAHHQRAVAGLPFVPAKAYRSSELFDSNCCDSRAPKAFSGGRGQQAEGKRTAGFIKEGTPDSITQMNLGVNPQSAPPLLTFITQASRWVSTGSRKCFSE